MASVIIPVRNMATLLERQLAALTHQDCDFDFEVIVADNGSSDHLEEVIARMSPHVPGLRLVDAAQRAGINHARNSGAHAARSDRLLFCDADDEVETGWVRGMVSALERGEAAGGLIRVQDITTGEWTMPAAPQRLLSTELPAAPLGATCAVRRVVWEELGTFDEGLDGGAGDETEFFWRLQSHGHRLVVADDAVLRYRQTTGERDIRRKEYRSARERVRLLRRFGLQPPPTAVMRTELRAWGSLVRDGVFAIGDPARRASFGRKVAKASGRAVGTVRFAREPQRHRPPPLPSGSGGPPR